MDVRNRIGCAIDRFQDRACAQVTSDDYYDAFVAELTDIVAEWMAESTFHTPRDRVLVGMWRYEMRKPDDLT